MKNTKHVLLTGVPGIGNTTIIKKLINQLQPLEPAGFYTQEIREKGIRQGFELVSLKGTRQAEDKLIQTMLRNLYLFPHLFQEPQEPIDMWHGSNIDEKSYLNYAPTGVFELWNDDEIVWAKKVYYSKKVTKVRKRYIEIFHQLQHTPRGEKRSELVKEAFKLKDLEFDSLDLGVDTEKPKVLKELCKIPGVGKKVAEDLWELRVRSIAKLKTQDPEMLYQKLCEQAGTKVDRCMLYVFRCAVYYASHDNHDPEKLKWWNWKDSNME